MAEDCGQCTSCLEHAKGSTSEEPREIPRSAVPDITVEDVSEIRALMNEGHAGLRTPRQLARFLCGLTSPATIRARLTKHDSFGLLEKVPFADVLAQTETMR
jgi:ATP-dependent DNA helicase RecQ